jgi:hypothetical protein
MGSFGTVLRMVVRRSVANRRLLATVIVGVIMSAALMSSVVMYSDAIRDLGLQHALRTSDPLKLDIRILWSARPGVPDYPLQKQKSREVLEAQTGGVVREIVHYGRAATFYLTPPGGAVPKEDSRPRAHFQFVDRLEEHTNLTEGRRPALASPGSPPTIEVAIGKDGAQQLGVKLGDTFDLHPFWRPEVQPVHVVVVGMIEPKDASEEYWFGKTDRFAVATTGWPTYPFFVSEETVVRILGGYLPDMDSSLETYALVDIGRINSRNARSIEDNVGSLSIVMREAVAGSQVETALPQVINSYRTKLFFTRLPLFALMLQIVGIALYYLVMVATMLVERQQGEIALLRSRGASTWQVMAIYLIEGLILCSFAAVLGPLLARGGIAVLGLTPPFKNLSDGNLLEAPISRGALGLAAGGAALALAAILWPAWRASRHSMIDYKHGLARPNQQPLFLRYYLDLGLVGMGAFLFYQLRERGSLVTDRLFGDLSADPLLLLSPTLFMLMVALVFLRLFPLALRLAAWLARGLSGPTIALGLSRMTRAPLHYSRLILLLLLATAVGMFAAGYRATLDRGYDDRAGFVAAAPSRLEGVRLPLNQTNATFGAQVATGTAAATVSVVSRQAGSYNLSQFRSLSVTVLGVSPNFDDVAFWRDDFASTSLEALLGRLPVEIQPPDMAEVPGGFRYIGVWTQFPLASQSGQPGIRLQDADGILWEYRLVSDGPPQAGTWQFYYADLSRPTNTRFGAGPAFSGSVPKRLDSVFVRITGNPPMVPERLTVLVDDVQLSMAQTVPQGIGRQGFADGSVVEDFNNFGRYELITGAGTGDPGAISPAPGGGRDGGTAARLSFSRERTTPPILGWRVKRNPGPLPVLAQKKFLDATDKKTGDVITIYVNRQYVQARIVGDFDLFPAHDPGRQDLMLVADLGSLQAIATRVPSISDGVFANEAWMSDTAPGTMTKEFLAPKGLQADTITSRADVRAAQNADPLVAASWEGILFLSFGAVLSLTALGFAVYAHVAAQTRSLEFAILRTMGYSNRQVLSLVTFEQLFVIVAGVAVGTFLGFPLGRLMIGYLGVTETGTDPVPPLISQVSWRTVFTVYGLLAIVFIGTIVSLAAVYSRLAVHKALRIGEL